MRPFPAAAPAAVLAALIALAVPASLPSAQADDRAPGAAATTAVPDVPQTSDGLPGQVVAPRSVWQRQAQRREDGPVRKLAVAPGVDLYLWEQDSDRGPNQMHLLTVKWQTPGVKVDYAGPATIADTTPVKTMLKADEKAGAVAGVNGDFFAISGTGAPRGVGRDLERGVLHGQLSGWNGAFSFKSTGWPQIGLLKTTTRVRYYPDIAVTSLNGPVVEPDEIGAYTGAWGDASGTAWTDGQKTTVRYVQVYNHRVTRVSTRLPQGHSFKGTLLVGRGKGAHALGALKVGARTDVLSEIEGNPRMAIGGNRFLLRRGVLQDNDDTVMHPRTAIGVDRDTKTLLLLVVDGRQSDSRGYTMAELADQMVALGADDALNLDGGGSSQLVAKRWNGLTVMNSPSDGYARPVANGIEVRYQAPR